MDTAPINEMQGYLRNISRAFGEIPLIVPDGNFSPQTTEAVKAFQSLHSLEKTGEVNFATWEKLREENRRALLKDAAPIQTTLIKSEDFPLKEGMSSQQIHTLKLMLFTLSKLYGNFAEKSPDDYFDSITKENVMSFQDIAFLEKTGEVDKETWNSLASLYLFI